MPRCFGIARKEEADCKASRPDEPKAKPYPSTEGINMKSLLAFDDYNLFEKIIALNFPFYDKNDVIEFFKGAVLKKAVNVHYGEYGDMSLHMDYADDLIVTELFYELACAKTSK